MISELVKLWASLQKVAGIFASFRKLRFYLVFLSLFAKDVKLRASLHLFWGIFFEGILGGIWGTFLKYFGGYLGGHLGGYLVGYLNLTSNEI